MDAFMQDVLESLIALTVALAAVLWLRGPWRQKFGASSTYALWSLVPIAVATVWLPARQQVIELMPVNAGTPPALLRPPSITTMSAAADWSTWLGLAWLLGAALVTWHLLRQQRAFRRGLGSLTPIGERICMAETREHLPAVVGLPGTIVLPFDFANRFSTEQQTLMLAHERVHLQRGDLWINAGVALMRTVCWFHPLVHYAARCLRFDQELACDARVLLAYPHWRRCYGETLLQAESLGHPVPLGCHAFGTHPLKERIAMLIKPFPDRSTQRLARWALAVLIVAGSTFTWATQTPSVGDAHRAIVIDLALERQTVSLKSNAIFNSNDGKPRLMALPGSPFSVALGEPDAQWEAEFVATESAPAQFDLRGKIRFDGELIGEPRLLVAAGKTARIEVSTEDGKHQFGMDMTLSWGELSAPPTPPQTPSVPAIAPMAPAPSIAPPAPPPPLASPTTPSIPAIAPMPPAPPIAPPAPPAPPPPLSSEVSMVSGLPPKYPASAMQDRLEGEVLLKLLVNEDGKPSLVSVAQSSGHVELDQAAAAAVETWQFKPGERDHRPVESWIMVPVTFSLDEASAEAGDADS